MTLSERTQDRLMLFGGKVGGIDCPNCQFESRDIELKPHSTAEIKCPECGRTILTEDAIAQLQHDHKL